MVSTIMAVIIVLGIVGILWMRRPRRFAATLPTSPATIPPQTLAMQAFAHGNSCLAAGQFAEARAAFHQARELDPKHPHIAGRLAEVARRQSAVSAAPLVQAPD
jgi:Flp pilus assembly protein TadD